MDDKRKLALKAMFLGPKAENYEIFEKLIIDALRDHTYWRRNFHPEDSTIITSENKVEKNFRDIVTRLEHKQFRLLAELKEDVPFFSPRYIGHMTSDHLLPAIVGFFSALLYNPNNVTSEASPVTTILELQVGLQLAKMLGYMELENDGELKKIVRKLFEKKDIFSKDVQEEIKKEINKDNFILPWAHITSGGTVANIESLWVARNLKYYPFAVRDSLNDDRFKDIRDVKVSYKNEEILIKNASDQILLNLPVDEILLLREKLIDLWQGKIKEDNARQLAEKQIDNAINKYSFSELGFRRFMKHKNFKPGVIILPRTKHYSWAKAAELLGLGRDQMIFIPLDAKYRMSIKYLEEKLKELKNENIPVISLVTVCGTTEEGAIDDIAGIIELKEKYAKEGYNFYVHCDAAYGGYFASLLYDSEGKKTRKYIVQLAEEISGGLKDKNICERWQEHFYKSFENIHKCDSITVDPHKLGYVPYPAGAIMFKNNAVRNLISCHAPYIFHEAGKETSFIGRYILEGSKAGASAAGVWLAHKVVKQNIDGYGYLLGETIKGAKYLYKKLSEVEEGNYKIYSLNEPDSNLVCFVVNRKNNDKLEKMNEINDEIYKRMSIGTQQEGAPVQSLKFLISKTKFDYEEYGPVTEKESSDNVIIRKGGLLEKAGINKGTFKENTGVIVLRMTVMDPWLLEKCAGLKGTTYLDEFIKELKNVIMTCHEEKNEQ